MNNEQQFGGAIKASTNGKLSNWECYKNIPLEKRSVQNLKSRAAALKIKNADKMKKEDLINAIRKKNGSKPASKLQGQSQSMSQSQSQN